MRTIVLSIFLLFLYANANQKQKVYITTKNIKYNTNIYPQDLIIGYKEINTKRCKDIDVIALNTNKYRAKSYLSKGRVICLKDLKLIKVKKVNFSFGGIVIEKTVEDVKETKQYVKIKTLDGKEEKIYKDGRNR